MITITNPFLFGAADNPIISMEITKLPNKLTYRVGENFSPYGMEVYVTYSDGERVQFLGYYFNQAPLTLQDGHFRISASEDVYEYIDLTVEEEKLVIPSVVGEYVYDGQIKVVQLENYYSEKMILFGSQTQTEAGEYILTFVPREGYRWEDGGTDNKEVKWTIQRANPYLLTVDEVVINNDSPQKEPEPERLNLEDLTWDEINGIALSGHAEDYLSVGDTKTVTLSSAVLGTTTHLIEIIGINQDNDNSITMQTKNLLNALTTFGSSAVWIGSTARSLCQSYYNYFPGKEKIINLNRGTAPNQSNTYNATATYNTETAFLLSEEEVGNSTYSALRKDYSTISNAECVQGKKITYQKYVDNTSRIKDQSDNGLAYIWWLRSRFYNTSSPNGICTVNQDGGADGYNYNYSASLAPAFTIGNPDSSSSLPIAPILYTEFTYATNTPSTPTAILTDPSLADVSIDSTNSKVTVTRKTDGSTILDLSFPISDNYNEISKTIPVEIETFNGFADATWEQIGKIISKNSGRLSSVFSVGETKEITLDRPVLGTTKHLIEIIGIEQDREGTLTLQTKNCLSITSAFDKSKGTWVNSQARSLCGSYYSALPKEIKDLVVGDLKRGICNDQPNGKNGTAVYNNEICWLPSEEEVGNNGYSSLSSSYSSISNAECVNGKKFGYGKYVDNSSRIKNQGDTGSQYYWWLRSRFYHTSTPKGVCRVDPNGTANAYTYTDAYGLAPAFTISSPRTTPPTIYGAEWDGTSTTAWVRTDAAASFSAPNPAISNGTGSSPFDSIMPWAGMIRVDDPEAGEMVAIPRFWYKWTKDGTKMKLQIADGPAEGFYVSPAHMDRGDGKGERDVVYIGRYHCASSTYKSTTGVAQQTSITRSTARTKIHNLGSTIWQMDFAMFWTIGMLYLVEFADWDGQTKIGYGCSSSGSKANNGQMDTCLYHTGTSASSRTSYGFTQYRNIEGWWDNVYDWMDGCYYTSSGLNVILDPSKFSDSANGILVGLPTSGYPSEFTIPSNAGLEWALFPNASSGSTTTYVPDDWAFIGSGSCLYYGGYYNRHQNSGPFKVSGVQASSADNVVGCRAMKLP